MSASTHQNNVFTNETLNQWGGLWDGSVTLIVFNRPLILYTSKVLMNLTPTYISYKDLTACFRPRASVWHASTHVARSATSIAAEATVHVHSWHAHPVKARAHPVHWHVAHATTCNTHTHTGNEHVSTLYNRAVFTGCSSTVLALTPDLYCHTLNINTFHHLTHDFSLIQSNNTGAYKESETILVFHHFKTLAVMELSVTVTLFIQK